jgi:hypothetical protein
MAETLRRVQMLLEPKQHALLAQLAKKQGRSVADITREAIAIGLMQLAEQDVLARRAQALKSADDLAERIQARTGRPLDIDVIEDLRRVREERDEQIGGRD